MTGILSTTDIIARFNDAFNRHDVEGVMVQMTDDCVFESTGPQPDGERFQGHQAVRECWMKLFDGSPDSRFDEEEMFAAGDRATVRWVYHYRDGEGAPGHIRGVDVFRVRDGKVAEKLAYVKG